MSEETQEPVEKPNIPEVPQTEEVFSERVKQLNKDVKATANNFEVEDTIFESKKADRRFIVDKILQGGKAKKEYNRFANFIGHTLVQDVKEFENKIDASNQLSDEVKKKLDIAVAAIKTAKEKLGVVDTKACKLGDAIKDSCNSDTFRILTENLRGLTDGFGAEIERIKTKADQTHDTADDAFETAVKVSGITAFTNVKSVKPFATSLNEKGAAFHADILENQDYNSGALKSSNDALAKKLEELSMAECARNKAVSERDATVEICNFVDCPTVDPSIKLNDLCKTVEEAFDSSELTGLNSLVEEKQNDEEEDLKPD